MTVKKTKSPDGPDEKKDVAPAASKKHAKTTEKAAEAESIRDKSAETSHKKSLDAVLGPATQAADADLPPVAAPVAAAKEQSLDALLGSGGTKAETSKSDSDAHEEGVSRVHKQEEKENPKPPMEAPKKDVAPVEQAKKAETPAAPAEITAPKIKKQSRFGSAFADFTGSIKYLGLGGEKNAIIQNLATMLNAGLPLIDSLKALQMEAKYKPIKKLLGSIIASVESGSPLWKAMAKEHFFAPSALALVRIGEEAGNLAENMEYLAQQQEKDQALKSKVKMAMIYPTIVFALMFIVVMGLGIFVLPNLITVLTSLNVELPFVTRCVIAFTNFMSANGAIIVPGSLAGIFFLIILAKFTPLIVVAQWIMFHIPGIGRLAREATIARFGVILGGLMQAGVPLVEALRSLADVTPIVAYRKFYVRLLDRILLGDSFAKSFSGIPGSTKILPISVQQLVMTGEKAGSLSKILLKIADIYEKKANETAQKLPVILEPMILLFIGALVGTIAMAIIVPIYSIVGNVGH